MFVAVRIFTTDKIWHKIFTDLGATVVPEKLMADLDFDSINLQNAISVPELQRTIFYEIDKNQNNILGQVFGKNVVLSKLQTQIIILLFKTGGLEISELKRLLGYAPDTATHAVDTALYQLRKTFGHEFIKNENGKYVIGKI